MDSRLLAFAFALLLCVGLAQPAHAQFVNQAADWAQKYWWRNCASLDMDFVHDQYYINGNTTCDGTVGTQYTAGSGNTGVVNFINGTGATFTRAGTTNVTDSNPPFYLDSTQGEAFVSRASVTNNVTQTGAPFYIGTTGSGPSQSFVSRADTSAVATYFNSSGVLQTASQGAARSSAYYYNGSSWVLGGTLIEPAATNSIRNNTMVGAVAGTPGTLPTNWILSNYGGVTYSVVGTGTEDGINYVDISFSGNVSGSFYLTLDSASATIGQTWTSSAFLKLTSGSLANITQAYLRVQDSSSSAGLAVANANLSSIGSGALSAARYSISETIPDVSAIKVGTLIYFLASGTVNFTLRIGMPQMELNPYSTASTGYATSVIATSGSAVTRAADVYNQQPASYFDSTGTLYFSPANTARTNYVYSGGSWVGGGTLNTPATTNTLTEPAATNGIRNNTMQGAVAADGVERTNNGTFSTTSPNVCSGSVTSGGNTLSCNNGSGTGWVGTINSGSGSITAASGSMTLTGDGTNAASIYEAIPTTSGYTYTIAVTTGSGNAVTVQAGTSAGGATLLAASSAAASTKTNYQFTASGSTSYVQINNTSTTAATVTTVSVQSAGEFPTDWFGWSQGAVNGIPVSIVGTGTESGINYVDVKFAGVATSTIFRASFDSTTAISASPGQTWTQTVYYKLTSGSFGSASTQLEIRDVSSGVSGSATDVSFTPTGSALDSQHFSVTRTLADSGTTSVAPNLRVGLVSGTSYNFTLRIGMPQLEQSSYATSAIPTYGSAVTRSADVYSIPSGGTYFNSAGVLKMAPANTPRLDYGPTGGNYPLGVLIEESRTNLMPNSYGISGVSTAGGGGANYILSSTLSPDGATDFSECQEGTSNGLQECRWNSNTTLSASTTYTASMFVEAAGDSSFSFLICSGASFCTTASYAWVNLSNGTITQCVNALSSSVGIQSIGSGVYRVYMTFTTPASVASTYLEAQLYDPPPSTCSQPPSFTGNGSSGVYIWGVQLEQGAFPTSYIPTSGSAVTRAADAFTLPTTAGGGSGWYTQGQGTLLGAMNSPYGPNNGRSFYLADIDDGTNQNAVQEFISSNGGGEYFFEIWNAGSGAGRQECCYTDGNLDQQVFAFQTNNSGPAANGTLYTDFTSVSIPTGLTTLRIGGGRGGGVYGGGWINRVTYFPIRHPDASLPGFTNY